MSKRRSFALAGAALLSLWLASCGGGGGDGNGNGGNSATPFPAASTDEFPQGARIDVSAKNLFQMATGDFWQYTTLDAAGNPTGAVASRQVTADDGSGGVSVQDIDGSAITTTDYSVNADGLLLRQPLGGDAPTVAADAVGRILEYATPLYPAGGVRRHVRSGAWGQDLDGDGIGESFRLEFTQQFLGFETLRLSPVFVLNEVARFASVIKFTIRPTRAGSADQTATVTEETWFAPGLGLVQARRGTADGAGATLDPLHTLIFSQGTVNGVRLNVDAPPPVLDGTFIDIALKHNALVYDNSRQLYYASIPGSVIGNGNRIATIEPSSGRVTYSAPVGSEPNALAISADSSVLYVGLDGSGDIVKLSLPGMNELGRTKLASESFFGQTRAQTLAASPAHSGVVAVAMGYDGVSPSHAGVALLRDMVLQPRRTQTHTGSNLIAFDATGNHLYGLNTETTEFGLRRIQVLADGLVEEFTVRAATDFGTRALSFSAGRVVAGNFLYEATGLEAAGRVSGRADCLPRRAADFLLCLGSVGSTSEATGLSLVDANTLVIRVTLGMTASAPGSRQKLVEGPPGQVALSDSGAGFGTFSKIRIFTSDALLSPPPDQAPVWPVAAFSTLDGQGLEIGIPHNALVYDSRRNFYYASVPGSLVGGGNSIAIIDPATGQVAHSAPIGSEPNALAIAADGTAIYVGLDGSGEVLRLALPSMAPLGRARLLRDPHYGATRAESIAVSPVNTGEAAVSMAYSSGSPGHAGVGLLRDMVLQPNRTQAHFGANLVAFDAAGTHVFGLGLSGSGLHRLGTSSDGLIEELVVRYSNGFPGQAFSFANQRVIAGNSVYDTPGLSMLGVISGARDCWPTRTGTGLICLGDSSAPSRVLVADSTNFVISAALTYRLSEQEHARRLAQGPAHQIAISYDPRAGATPWLRLFTSPQLP